MKKRFLFWTVGLAAVMISAACVPVAIPTNPIPTPTFIALPVATQAVETVTQVQAPTETPTSAVQPAATSRGPNLEATDPTTVALASEGLQLVEFFRFT